MGPPELSLDVRLAMVLDLARAMLYLHSQRPPILHLNLNASSILVCVPSTQSRAGGAETCLFSSLHA